MNIGRYGARGLSRTGVVWVGLTALAMTAATFAGAAESMPISLETSHPKLAAAFLWARDKALSYVQTGKNGPVDRHEHDRGGGGSAAYMPCYWAGYTFRTAFYSRDYCHQAAGAHLLGLQRENLAMLRAFAASATAGRKWFPLWALNFDGSPFKLDHRSDTDFVREVPAVFELVEQCYRQYLWTGDEAYLRDPAISGFCSNAVTRFIEAHDTRIPNGVAEGDGSGDIFRGSATYNEIRSPLVEAGDGIACEYQALRAQALLMAARGETEPARLLQTRAEKLKDFFNARWGVKPGVGAYVRGYDAHGEAVTDFGRENSWFMPMKFITDPSPKTDAYLDFVARSVDDPRERPGNLEAISYLPGVFFPYHRAETAWKWLEYIIDQPDREYPEISYTLIGHVVEGLLGVEPNAARHEFLTVSHLPRAIASAGVRNIRLGDHLLDVSHQGASRSVARHGRGGQSLRWQACFPGRYPEVLVDGDARPARSWSMHGVEVSSVVIELQPGRSATAEVRAKP